MWQSHATMTCAIWAMLQVTAGCVEWIPSVMKKAQKIGIIEQICILVIFIELVGSPQKAAPIYLAG
jgi:hypothetical protein